MNGIYFCKLFLESTFTFTNWNLNLQLTNTLYTIAYHPELSTIMTGISDLVPIYRTFGSGPPSK